MKGGFFECLSLLLFIWMTIGHVVSIDLERLQTVSQEVLAQALRGDEKAVELNSLLWIGFEDYEHELRGICKLNCRNAKEKIAVISIKQASHNVGRISSSFNGITLLAPQIDIARNEVTVIWEAVYALLDLLTADQVVVVLVPIYDASVNGEVSSRASRAAFEALRLQHNITSRLKGGASSLPHTSYVIFNARSSSRLIAQESKYRLFSILSNGDNDSDSAADLSNNSHMARFLSPIQELVCSAALSQQRALETAVRRFMRNTGGSADNHCVSTDSRLTICESDVGISIFGRQVLLEDVVVSALVAARRHLRQYESRSKHAAPVPLQMRLDNQSDDDDYDHDKEKYSEYTVGRVFTSTLPKVMNSIAMLLGVDFDCHYYHHHHHHHSSTCSSSSSASASSSYSTTDRSSRSSPIDDLQLPIIFTDTANATTTVTTDNPSSRLLDELLNYAAVNIPQICPPLIVPDLIRGDEGGAAESEDKEDNNKNHNETTVPSSSSRISSTGSSSTCSSSSRQRSRALSASILPLLESLGVEEDELSSFIDNFSDSVASIYNDSSVFSGEYYQQDQEDKEENSQAAAAGSIHHKEQEEEQDQLQESVIIDQIASAAVDDIDIMNKRNNKIQSAAAEKEEKEEFSGAEDSNSSNDDDIRSFATLQLHEQLFQSMRCWLRKQLVNFHLQGFHLIAVGGDDSVAMDAYLEAVHSAASTGNQILSTTTDTEEETEDRIADTLGRKRTKEGSASCCSNNNNDEDDDDNYDVELIDFDGVFSLFSPEDPAREAVVVGLQGGDNDDNDGDHIDGDDDYENIDGEGNHHVPSSPDDEQPVSYNDLDDLDLDLPRISARELFCRRGSQNTKTGATSTGGTAAAAMDESLLLSPVLVFTSTRLWDEMITNGVPFSYVSLAANNITTTANALHSTRPTAAQILQQVVCGGETAGEKDEGGGGIMLISEVLAVPPFLHQRIVKLQLRLDEFLSSSSSSSFSLLSESIHHCKSAPHDSSSGTSNFNCSSHNHTSRLTIRIPVSVETVLQGQDLSRAMKLHQRIAFHRSMKHRDTRNSKDSSLATNEGGVQRGSEQVQVEVAATGREQRQTSRYSARNDQHAQQQRERQHTHRNRHKSSNRRETILLTHMCNEEHILPQWIRHHAPMFDRAYIIDYNSTVSSLAILTSQAPSTWRVIPTRNKVFSSRPTDIELIEYERKHPSAWKIVLTLGEFLVSSDLRELLRDAVDRNVSIIRFPSYAIVGDDDSPSSPPFNPQRSLLSLRSVLAVNPMQPREWFGINRYARFMHHDLPVNISYGSGRHHMEYNGELLTTTSAASIQHALNLSAPFGIEVVRDGSFIAKYKWSPWPENIKKMLVINQKYVERNLNENEDHPPGLRIMTHQFGTEEELIAERNEVLRTHYLFNLDSVPVLLRRLSSLDNSSGSDGGGSGDGGGGGAHGVHGSIYTERTETPGGYLHWCSLAAESGTCSNNSNNENKLARRCKEFFLYDLRAAHHRTWLEVTNGVPNYLIDTAADTLYSTVSPQRSNQVDGRVSYVSRSRRRCGSKYEYDTRDCRRSSSSSTYSNSRRRRGRNQQRGNQQDKDHRRRRRYNHVLSDRFLQPIRLIDHTGSYTTKYVNVSFCDLMRGSKTVAVSSMNAASPPPEVPKKSRLHEDIESFCIHEAAYPDLGQCVSSIESFLRAFIVDPNQHIV